MTTSQNVSQFIALVGKGITGTFGLIDNFMVFDNVSMLTLIINFAVIGILLRAFQRLVGYANDEIRTQRKAAIHQQVGRMKQESNLRKAGLR